MQTNSDKRFFRAARPALLLTSILLLLGCTCVDVFSFGIKSAMAATRSADAIEAKEPIRQNASVDPLYKRSLKEDALNSSVQNHDDLNEDAPYVTRSKSGPDIVLTFQYGPKPTGPEGMDWWSIADEYSVLSLPGWLSSGATKAVIDSSFASYHPSSTAWWFANLSAMTEIEGLANIDTASVRNMFSMFGLCEHLQTLDLSSFTMSASTNVNSMFSGCKALQTLVLGNNAKLKVDTMLHGIAGTTDAFWRRDMQTAVNYNLQNEAESVAAINAVLDSLPQGASQTFTYATMRLIYDANGGYFKNAAEEKSELFGNPGEEIGDNTPVPTREGYSFLGYAATATATTPDTPMKFPEISVQQGAGAGSTTFYAVWKEASPGQNPSADALSSTSLLPQTGDTSSSFVVPFMFSCAFTCMMTVSLHTLLYFRDNLCGS